MDPGEPQTRLAGPGRYDTSAAVSAATFAPGVPVVYLATGLKFPDALAGAAAAGTAGGPVLLTAPTSLPPAIAAELERLDPQRIVLLGDANSISETVRTLARQYTTGSVDRIAGIDRYATSAAIALDTYQGVEGIDVVYLATGLTFPDALAGAAAGGSLGGPVLLTQPDKLPEATRGALQTLKPKRIVLLGDANSVSQAVAGQVAGYASIGVDRKAGIDRYATAAAIAGEFGTDVPVVYLATGLNFPDALSGTAAAGYQNGPVLLTMPDKLPPATAQALANLKPRKVIVLGDQKSEQDSVLAQALQFVVVP